MKTRHDFVSNSSSSSFILKDDGFFKHFNITKQDIFNALFELYVDKDILHKIAANAIASSDVNFPCANGIEASNLLDVCASSDDFWLFKVYDITDKDDREKCFEEWDEHFSEWYAPNEGEYHDWQDFIDMLRQKCSIANVDEVALGKNKDLKYTRYDYSQESQEFSMWHDVKLIGSGKLVEHIKNSLGIKTMKEVLHDSKCTMMIHFGDNEVYSISGMNDDGASDPDYAYESEPYSADRFFEVLIMHFISKGKVDLSDIKLLERWKINDRDVWYKTHHPGEKYYVDGGKLTWKRIVDDLLNCNAIMHEG